MLKQLAKVFLLLIVYEIVKHIMENILIKLEANDDRENKNAPKDYSEN